MFLDYAGQDCPSGFRRNSTESPDLEPVILNSSDRSLTIHPDRAISNTPELLRHSDMERGRSKQHVSLRQFLLQDVDPKEATGPLASYCFMTGYMCTILTFLFFIPSLLVVATLFLSLQYSYGVGFKPATLPRCVLSRFLSNHRLSPLIACHCPRSPLRRPSRSPRHFLPQS